MGSYIKLACMNGLSEVSDTCYRENMQESIIKTKDSKAIKPFAIATFSTPAALIWRPLFFREPLLLWKRKHFIVGDRKISCPSESRVWCTSSSVGISQMGIWALISVGPVGKVEVMSTAKSRSIIRMIVDCILMILGDFKYCWLMSVLPIFQSKQEVTLCTDINELPQNWLHQIGSDSNSSQGQVWVLRYHINYGR